MSNPNVVIVSAKRTPIGAFQGVLTPLTAPQLGSAAAQAAIAAAGIQPADIQEVIMGCVLAAGLGQAPARQAALGAGVPAGTPATTTNKMCGSGLKAVMMAADQIRAGEAEVVLAGGIESMSRIPYLIDAIDSRWGHKMGNFTLVDAMYRDGFHCPLSSLIMGETAEVLARQYGITRVRPGRAKPIEPLLRETTPSSKSRLTARPVPPSPTSARASMPRRSSVP